MGSTNSKVEKTEALKMCKLRKKLIKQAIDSRYSIAASHVSYTQSLKHIGVALRRFAEAEVLIESSLSPSGNTIDKTPSPSSYPSPSTSHIAEDEAEIPQCRLSYMKSSVGGVSVAMRYNPHSNIHSFVENKSQNIGGVNEDIEVNEEDTLVLPPPPPPDCGSWDFFDPGGDEAESFRFVGLDDVDHNSSESVRMWGGVGVGKGKEVGNVENLRKDDVGEVGKLEGGASIGRKEGQTPECSGSKREKSKVEKEVSEEREDPSEFITHRAKDFLSSIKDIEVKFFRASEAGKEVARMLEANKIRVGYAEAKGNSSPLDSLAVCPMVCCRGKSVHASNDLHPQTVPKVIVWNRSMSSHSSSSRNPLATPSKDDADDSGSECLEDFCMISGSHSSTLDRLYAWERKLYDEVKASEVIRKGYERKCSQLRHQFAKDVSSSVIDKTRSTVKDLHSRIRVALHAVDSIAKRIEKMRDEELLPQLNELITGLIRMWKAMLECHHAQYITISLAYHARSSMGTPGGDSQKEIMAQLQYEFECFGLSFADWMNSHTSYVEAINGWLQNCVMQPQERTRGSRRPFSPRRVLAPPIFVLCRDWSAGINALPSEDVSDAIRNFLSDLHHLTKQQQQSEEKKDAAGPESNDNPPGKDEDTSDGKSGNLGCIHTSLIKVLDKLTKFSEASLKLYEDIRQKSEAARVAYANPRPFRYS